MRRPLAMAVVLFLASAVPAWAAAQRQSAQQPSAQQPSAHPAVVRVIVPEGNGVTYGSGALIAVNETHGLVVTNWHVVRGASGPVMVVFPDGFRSRARVLKTNRHWDLAALAIWRPNVRPIALATAAPRRGDALTIVGYGPGWYRAATGRCIQYVSPGGNNPFEMIELSAGARNGDSGGPILNTRGELAGVLFGSAFGRTTGSYCGRVKWFLASVADDFQGLPSGPTMIAQQPRRRPAVAAIAAAGSEASRAGASAAEANRSRGRPVVHEELASLPAAGPRASPGQDIARAGQPLGSTQPAGPTRGDQIKTILAAIGILAILFHGLRLVAAAQQS